MCLKKVTTTVTYKVPAWEYCNLQAGYDRPSKEMCRFCVKDRTGYRCTLYNTTLDVRDTALALKNEECRRAVAGYESIVEDADYATGPDIDPKDIIKATLAEYNKVYKKLLADGYPEFMVNKLAQKHVIGGML